MKRVRLKVSMGGLQRPGPISLQASLFPNRIAFKVYT
jgi:hypothetical protein